MSTVTLEEAQARLPELIAALQPGEALVITRDGRPAARLVGGTVGSLRREPGFLRGTVLHMAEDFDATPEDFRDYLQ